MRGAGSLFMIICGLFLSGCMPLTSSRPPPTIYVLHPPPAKERQETSKIVNIISIPEPEVPNGFDTNKIALYLYNGRRLDYYANMAWPERLGKVLQDVIVQSAPFVPGTVVMVPDTGGLASYDLFVKVNDFEPVYAATAESPPLLKVSMSFRLISRNTQRLLLNTRVSAEARAVNNTQTAVISGLESLLHDVSAKAFKKIIRVL
jgi:ABC-type uncharacterized transport system auxiliary subunit